MTEVERLRKQARSLRSRYIWHRKRGRQALKLLKAYQRTKAALALAIRKARRKAASRAVTRAQWGAAPPRGGYTAQGTIRGIVVHHTASSMYLFGKGVAAEAAHVREVQRWHFQRGFSDVGYAKLIGPSGTVFNGRPESVVGAHTLNSNTGWIGLALLGNFEQESPTPEALRSLKREIARIRSQHGSVPVAGHRDRPGHSTNACPGRNLYRQLPE